MSCCLALILLVAFPIIGAMVLAIAAVGLMAALALASAYCTAIGRRTEPQPATRARAAAPV
jgi:hypothetical protein